MLQYQFLYSTPAKYPWLHAGNPGGPGGCGGYGAGGDGGGGTQGGGGQFGGCGPHGHGPLGGLNARADLELQLKGSGPQGIGPHDNAGRLLFAAGTNGLTR